VGYGADDEWGGAPTTARRDALPIRVLRALSGSVAAGLVVLTAVVIGVAYYCSQRELSGPGAESISVHVIGSAFALAAQWFADRRRALAASLWSTAVLATAVLVLMTQWWS
jgi:hypothetical protein